MISHTPTQAPTPGAPRIPHLVVLAGPCLVGAAAAVASFKFTAEFGRNNAWPGLSSYLLPATVDGLAVVAWWRAAFGGGGRLAWACGWGTTLVSVAANAAGHAGIQGEAWTIVAGGWPALCLALMVHLLWFPPRLPDPPVWAEVADGAPEMSGAVVSPRGPAPDAAAPTPAPATAEGPVAGEHSRSVGAADTPAAVEGAGTVLDPAGTPTLAALIAEFDAATTPDTEPDELPVELEAWAATVTDEELAEDARRRDKASVRKLLATYKVPDSRARRVAGLIRQGVTA